MYSSNNYSVSIHFKTLSCKIYTHNFYFTVNIVYLYLNLRHKSRENKYGRFERVLFGINESKIYNTLRYTIKYSDSKRTTKCTKSINAYVNKRIDASTNIFIR